MIGDDDRDTVYVSAMPPILNYALGRGWTVGRSGMSVTYDCGPASRWAGESPSWCGPADSRFQTQYGHDFANYQIGPRDTLRFTVKFLFPAG